MEQSKVFKIDNDKVYTSSYSYACSHFPDHRLLRISQTAPEKFNGKSYEALFPGEGLLYWYKDNIRDMINSSTGYDEAKANELRQLYEQRYRNNVLNKLDAEEVYQSLKGKVLLCWCDKENFCHRHIVMAWLSENIGENIVGGEIQ